MTFSLKEKKIGPGLNINFYKSNVTVNLKSRKDCKT